MPHCIARDYGINFNYKNKLILRLVMKKSFNLKGKLNSLNKNYNKLIKEIINNYLMLDN